MPLPRLSPVSSGSVTMHLQDWCHDFRAPQARLAPPPALPAVTHVSTSCNANLKVEPGFPSAVGNAATAPVGAVAGPDSLNPPRRAFT